MKLLVWFLGSVLGHSSRRVVDHVGRAVQVTHAGVLNDLRQIAPGVAVGVVGFDVLEVDLGQLLTIAVVGVFELLAGGAVAGVADPLHLAAVAHGVVAGEVVEIGHVAVRGSVTDLPFGSTCWRRSRWWWRGAGVAIDLLGQDIAVGPKGSVDVCRRDHLPAASAFDAVVEAILADDVVRGVVGPGVSVRRVTVGDGTEFAAA